jgi:predicted enzyme related to lactoylglutathione lyase
LARVEAVTSETAGGATWARVTFDRGDDMPTVAKHETGVPSWFDLMTPDMDKAMAFYGGLFGWTYERGGAEYGGYSMCKVGDRYAAGMGPLTPDMQAPSAWTVYLASSDVDASAAKVAELGGTVMMPPMTVGDQGRLLVAADPTGAVFGCWQAQQHTGAQVTGEHGAMAWSEVATRDAGKARDFYARLLALEPRQMEGAPGGMIYHTLHKGPLTAFGVMQMPAHFPKDMPAHWMAYFAVDDVDLATAKVDGLGGKLVHPAFDSPYGRMAVVADPCGAVFTIIKSAPRS